MDELIELYLEDRTLRGDLAPSSVPVIRSALRRFVRHCGGELHAVDARDVWTWIDPDRYAEQTRKSMLTKLRPFVQWLVERRLIPADFTIGIRVSVNAERAPRDLPHDAVVRLLDVCPDRRAQIIVLLMVQCGLRAGEVARTRIEDIDQRRHVLAVRGKGGRGEVNGYVYVPDEAWRLVMVSLRARGALAGPFICSLNSTGYRPLTPHTVSKLVGRWLKDAGLKTMPHDGISAHALRHTCAQDILDTGADPRKVQYALRHKSLRTTEIYLRREPPGLREAMEGRHYAGGQLAVGSPPPMRGRDAADAAEDEAG